MGLSGMFSDPTTGLIDQPLYAVVLGVNVDHVLKTATIRVNAYVSSDTYHQGLGSLRPLDQVASDVTPYVANVQPTRVYTDWFSPTALEAAAKETPPVDIWHQAYRWLLTLSLFASATFDDEIN